MASLLKHGHAFTDQTDFGSCSRFGSFVWNSKRGRSYTNSTNVLSDRSDIITPFDIDVAE
jgi:hypothetical protein